MRPDRWAQIYETSTRIEVRQVPAPTAQRPVVCSGCAQQCGVLVHVEDGRIQAITGDRDHPVSAGFICPKGANAHELHYDPSRVHYPLRRRGPRGGGEWERIGWEDALDDIAESLVRLADRHGPEAVAYTFGTLHGADWGLGERFMNLFGSPNTIGQDKVCYGPNALGEALTYGWGPTFYTYPVPGKTGCMIVWGMRPSASMPLLWKQIVKAQRDGAKLIVIDPEQTHEARHADLWLQNRPGSDLAVALGLIDRVISEGLYDEDTVRERTVGFHELRARASDYPPNRVSDLAWVNPEALTEAARAFATSGPGIIHGGNGLCQSGSMAVQCGRALACLVAITGNLGVEGGHALAGPPRDLVSNGDAVLADALSEDQRAKRLGADTFPHIGRGYGQLDRALSAGWYGKKHTLSWLATGHEPTLWKAITTGQPYPIKALIVQYHNAIGAGANARLAQEALASKELELLVVQDLFVNPTSRLADYLLPASHWLEKPFFSVAYGYMGFAGDYAEASQAAIPAEFEHCSDYDLWRELGRRTGQASDWPDTAELFWDELAKPAGLRFDALSEIRGPVVGADARTSTSTTATPSQLGTPSGMIELTSSLLDNWGIDPLPDYRLPEIFAKAGDDFPLILTTGGRTIEGFHQNAQQMSAFRRRHAHPHVRMHPITAADARIEEGDWILIETPVGSVRQQARLTEALAPRIVQADRWWYPERSGDAEDPFGFWSTNINVCTANDTGSCDPIMGTWLLRGLPCRLIPADGPPH